MPIASVKLKPITVDLDHLYLDPNNPRFAKSLDLAAIVPDNDVPGVQQRVENLFVNERDSERESNEDESEAEEGKVRIGDLVRSMQEIGFVPIDRVVVRKLDGSATDYVVIEGNRRVRAAKYLRGLNISNPEQRRKHDEIVPTLEKLDVLLLDTSGLSPAEINHQIGVILGLRHFGQVLGWGTLAKAVNIHDEYMRIPPVLQRFKLEASRISLVHIRLSESRSGVMSALKTYLAYNQLQNAFPIGGPKPTHYSLLQACVTNRKLVAAKFIEQDGNTFELSQSSLEKLNTACEFESRDTQRGNILTDPKSVSPFAGLVADAESNRDLAIKAYANSLLSEVLGRQRSLDDAVDDLKSFKSNRVWTEALEALFKKVVEPGESSEGVPSEPETDRLALSEFRPEHIATDYLDNLKASTDTLEVLIYEGTDSHDISWLLQGIRHISGVRDWEPAQRARLLVDRIDNFKLGFKEAGQQFGLSAQGVGRLYRAYKGLQQMREDDEFQAKARNEYFSLFEETLRSEIMRNWLGWDKVNYRFTNEDNLKMFYSWVVPDDENNNKRRIQNPKHIKELAFLIEKGNQSLITDIDNFDIGISEAFGRAIGTPEPHDWRKSLSTVEGLLKSIPLIGVGNEPEEFLAELQELSEQIARMRAMGEAAVQHQ